MNVSPQGHWWKFCHLFQIAPHCLETGEMGRSQRPLLTKTTTAGNLNIADSHLQGNLFPSRKLKGSCTFTAWTSVEENHETEEDLGPKPNGKKDTRSSAEEDVGMLGKVGNADWPLGYITWFASAVELYQKKNHNVFGCGSPDHLMKDCPKDLGKTTRKEGLNLKERMVKKGGWFLRSW